MPSPNSLSIQELKKQITAIESGIESSKSPAAEQVVEDDTDATYKQILRLISFRDRSAAELRKRFAEKEVEARAIEEAIARAQKCGVLDDIRFAESLIRGHVGAGKGKKGTEYELEKHAIDPYDVPGWPFEFFPSEEEEIQQAVMLLKKKPPTAKNKREAAFRRLISKGYSSSVASSAIQIWLRELGQP